MGLYHRVVYFPLEQKFSIWDSEYNLIKEWFETRESAIEYMIVNQLLF